MNTTKSHRESPRLPSFDYLGHHAYHLVTATRARQPHLAIAGAARMCADALAESCGKYSFRCLAYCFMPDHAHVLVASEGGLSVERFIRHFKQLTGWRFKKKTGEHLWQISYYDHIVRHDEAIESIALYIWGNPVRAGLAKDMTDYPYSGPREYIPVPSAPSVGGGRSR